MTREEHQAKVMPRAEDAAEERILDLLLPPARDSKTRSADDVDNREESDGAGRQRFRKLLREGKLDDKEIEIEVSANPVGVEIINPSAGIP